MKAKKTLRNNVYERQRKANEIRNRLEQGVGKKRISKLNMPGIMGRDRRANEKMCLL